MALQLPKFRFVSFILEAIFCSEIFLLATSSQIMTWIILINYESSVYNLVLLLTWSYNLNQSIYINLHSILWCFLYSTMNLLFSLWFLESLESPLFLDTSSSSFPSLEVSPIHFAHLLAIQLLILSITANTSSWGYKYPTIFLMFTFLSSQTFFSYEGCLLDWLIVTLQKHFSFMSYHLFIIDLIFSLTTKLFTQFSTCIYWNIFPNFSSSSFRVSVIILKSLLHFALYFVQYKR